MPKLTPEEIQFIDNYLKESGVEYTDIRFEMTDHVACVLEESNDDFYDSFKAYMLKNKAKMLENNKRFKQQALKRAWVILCKNTVKPVFLLLFAVITLAYLILKNTMGIEAATDVMRAFYSVVIIAVSIHNVRDRHVVKVKFSVSDKLIATVCIVMYWVVYTIHVETYIKNPTMLMVYYAGVNTLAVVVYYTFISLTRQYKRQFVK